MSSRLISALAAAALAVGTPWPAFAAPQAEPLSVAVIWHQHQPQYPKAPGTNVYEQPWVRLHGTKDYYDMAAMVKDFPGLKLTVNLTPVLLQQIEDYNRGATDRHFVLAAKPAAALTESEKAEAHRRFFQVSGPMMTPFPRLSELKRKPLAQFSTQDWLDLQVLFHLAWTDPMFRANRALAPLMRKGRSFTEADKQRLLAEHKRIMARIIPLHRDLQREGRLEITTTPYFHPILPLLHDTALAKEAMPHAPMPAGRMRRPEDARFHVDAAVAYYRRLFGRAPRGMWPGEGSVAQAVAPAFKAAGIRWIATDEEVLARSLKLNLREGDQLTRPDVLYQPYQVSGGPAVVFRDRKLSDDIGFRYSKMKGEEAAKDLLGQLRAIAKTPAKGPRLVSIILDGENAWENYPDDGKAFLNALYRGLTTDKAFRTTTPSEYLARRTPKPLPRLWAGSWIQASYATWIGEDEENAAWDLLIRARDAVEAYGDRAGRRDRRYLAAMGKIYAAEGSDWFWWYGQDQDSGRDAEFDEAFRRLLSSAYAEIGEKPPTALSIPLIQAGAKPTREPKAYLTPTIDGVFYRQEWADAGSLFAQGGAMNVGDQKVAALFYGWNKEHLFLAAQFNGPVRPLTVHLGLPGKPGGVQKVEAGMVSHFEARLDPATQAGSLTAAGKAAAIKGFSAMAGRELAEFAIPWAALGVRSGEPVLLSLRAEGDRPFPPTPLKIQVPVLALKPVVTLEDASDPGVGPGTYTLPTGTAYTRESVDLKRLSVADGGDRWIFTWQLGEVRNPWGSPVGLSLVSLDLYLALAEEAGDLTGLLPERRMKATRPWAYALNVEGWQQALYRSDGQKVADLAVAVDPLSDEVRAYVPKALLPGQPAYWNYLAIVSGQDGFAPGRIRAVLKSPDADHFGGRADESYPQALDVLLPADLPQNEALVPAYGQVVVPYMTPSGKIEGTE